MREKKHITDFALWKFSSPQEKRQMEWDSPWGVGFPGWHIECSAMSMKYLGESFDIHCGGKDHIPIHHTNEIAQSEAATGKPYVRYWMHSAFLNIEEEKMSKSKGSFLTLSSLEERGFSPLAYRFLVLQAHYRKELRFGWENLEAAAQGLNRLYHGVQEIKRQCSLPVEAIKASAWGKEATEYYNSFAKAIFHDLNSAKCIAVVFDLLKDKVCAKEEKMNLLLHFDTVLGLGIGGQISQEQMVSLDPEISSLLEQRKQARAKKDFAQSDLLRQKIEEKGYRVIDEAQETRLELKRK